MSVDLNTDDKVTSTLSESEFNLLKVLFAPEKLEMDPKTPLSKMSGLYAT